MEYKEFFVCVYFSLSRPLLNHLVESHFGNHHLVRRAVVERHEIGRHQLEVGLVFGLVVVEPATDKWMEQIAHSSDFSPFLTAQTFRAALWAADAKS